MCSAANWRQELKIPTSVGSLLFETDLTQPVAIATAVNSTIWRRQFSWRTVVFLDADGCSNCILSLLRRERPPEVLPRQRHPAELPALVSGEADHQHAALHPPRLQDRQLLRGGK
ncbi:hypothetical protein AVEN_10609-1, partial [Araneus ventricosus]